MALEHKSVVGLFPDLQHTESALSQLTATGFPTHNVSVVVQQLNSKKGTWSNLTEPIVQSEEHFLRHGAIGRIEHGALYAGAWGSVAGGLLVGLSTLALPVVGGFCFTGRNGNWSLLWSRIGWLARRCDRHWHFR